MSQPQNAGVKASKSAKTSANKGGGHALVIVESPAKARTIGKFLGDGFVVESSIGHIRDLPKKAADIPAAVKKEPWARLGVDVDHGFKPLYVVDNDKKDHIKKLKALLADAHELYLATDEDREGEAIAWHLHEVLNPKVPVRRMVFHEITKKAIDEAIDHPRQIDQRLVDAQEARRVLDRLYGYEVSPVLWKKVMPRLSAGRVQSVATRILVERERERMRFVEANYWDVEATFEKSNHESFTAALTTVGDKRVASGKDFDSNGKIKSDKVRVLSEQDVRSISAGLKTSDFKVVSVEAKPYKRTPSAPFMTSTLQQEAGRKLRFSAQRAMKAAQRLYEAGYITYMRTDSTTLSATAVEAARKLIQKQYGADYLPASPRTYANKVKNAQEAHEAIRPAGDVFRMPEEVANEVEFDQAKLYELIWKRTVASQMKDAQGESIAVRIQGTTSSNEFCEFSCSGNTITFPGFLRAYVEGSDDPEAELESKEKHLPILAQNEKLAGKGFESKHHMTQAPARYTEASLVKRLEELGVGRPSTYAATISTILDRGYVFKKGTALVPSLTAFAVVGLLEQHFPALVDFEFTAKMEDDLDAIASGNALAAPWLHKFYFGKENLDASVVQSGLDLGLRALVNDNLGEIDARAVNSIPIGKDENGVDVVARVGRYGPYLQRGEDTVSISDDTAPDELTIAKALEFLQAPSGDRTVGVHPETGLNVYSKSGRYGAYIQMGEAGGDEKPKTASLFASMTPQTVTMEDAIKLLSLPRVLGKGADGEEITAQNGRYGPYIQKGKESRSLEGEDKLFTVTLEEAFEILAKPKERGRRNAGPTTPARELGADPVSGKTITVKNGKFGPYVTDGITMASLRKGDSPETIAPERAHELLGERRSRDGDGGGAKKKAPAKRRAAPKSSAPRPPAQTTARVVKKAAKKKAAKKASKKA